MSAAAAASPATVAAAFAASVERYPGHDFLELLPETAAAFGIGPRRWSYAEAAAEVARLRAGYAAAGYGHGHRAGLLLLNRPQFLFHFLALNGLGVSVVPISPDWRAAELEYLLEHSEISVAACLPENARALAEAATATGRNLAITGPDGTAIPAAGMPAPGRERAPDADSECALLYTSGTIGRPKGCVLPNEYFLCAGRWYTEVGGLCDVRPGVERLLTPLPMMHMNALAFSTMCMILSGGCLVLLDRFHPRQWWASVQAARATIVHYLGVMPALLLAAPASPDDRRHAVRFGFGAGVDPRHHAAFEARFGFPLLEAWAMTETGAGAVLIANREPRHVGTACIGTPQPQVECRVVDEAGAEAPAGAAGELLVRHAGPRAALRVLSLLPQGRGGHERGLGGRLVPHRRRGEARCRGGHALRRPPQEPDPAQRREHLGRGGGGGARAAPGGAHRRRQRGRPMSCAATRSSPASCPRRRSGIRSTWRASSPASAGSGWPTTRRPATWPSSTRCR